MEKDKQDLINNGLRVNSPANCEEHEFLVGLLKTSLNNKDVRHIGLIGSYGAGKSSVIKRYKSYKDDPLVKKTIDVSLTEFEGTIDRKERELESILIQQILFSVKPCKIPLSKVKRIGISIFPCLAIIFAILFVGFIVAFEQKLLESINPWVNIAIGGILLLGFIFFLMLSFPISRVRASFKNLEIEGNKDDNSTLFDDYFDELRYFFKKTGKRYVIFEDIDRCVKSTELFSRLYTLNKTLNGCPDFKDDPIKFIYAVKEDEFKSSEQKSKFFDVMISVPPIFTAKNSKERLKEALTEDEQKLLSQDKDVFKNISEQIHYYRQLNNIINSYHIFCAGRDLTDYHKTSIFILMVFKSNFPKDYKNYIIGKGFLSYIILHPGDDYNVLLKDFKGNHYIKPDDLVAEKNLKEIKEFYNNFRKYLRKDTVSLVSSFTKSIYDSEECKLFYENIDNLDDIDNFSFKYNKPEVIFKHDDCINNIEKAPFLNFCLIKYLVSNKNQFPNIYNLFVETFSDFDNKRKDFLVEAINEFIDDKSFDFLSFVNDVIKVNPLIFEKVYLDEGKISDDSLYRIMLSSLNTIELFENANKNNNVIFSINNSERAIEYFSSVSEELRNYIFTLENLKIKKLKDSANFDNEILKLIISKRFFTYSQDNLNFILSKTGENVNNNLFTIMHKYCNNFQLIDIYLEMSTIIDQNLSNESEEVVNHLLSSPNVSKLSEASYDSLKPFKPDLKLVTDGGVLFKCINKKIIKGTIDDFGIIRSLINSKIYNISVSSYILENFDLLLESENKNDDNEFPNFMFTLLNYEKSNHDNIGRILTKIAGANTIDMSKINNDSVGICIIEFKYAKFNSALIEFANVNFDKVANYLFNNYHFDIMSDKLSPNLYNKGLVRSLLNCALGTNLYINYVKKFEHNILQNLNDYKDVYDYLVSSYNPECIQIVLSMLENSFTAVKLKFGLYVEYFSLIPNTILKTTYLDSIISVELPLKYECDDISQVTDVRDFVNTTYKGKYRCFIYKSNNTIIIRKI